MTPPPEGPDEAREWDETRDGPKPTGPYCATDPGTCPTPDCSGDARYAAPGRGHKAGCTYPAATDPGRA